MDAIWSSPIPHGHSVVTAQVQQKHSYSEGHEQEETGGKKQARLGGKKLQAPDFISSTPLIEPIIPIPTTSRSITMTLIKRIAAPVQFPHLPSANGTSQTICLNSVFPAPHNCCMLRLCGDKKAVPRIPRLHIDMSKEPWRSKPENYWKPMVDFLQNEAIRQHLRPSAALKQATPSANWQ